MVEVVDFRGRGRCYESARGRGCRGVDQRQCVGISKELSKEKEASSSSRVFLSVKVLVVVIVSRS